MPDPRDHLPRDAYYHLAHILRSALPPGEGTPETIALCPGNAAEAAVAAQFVAANMQAMACLRLAQEAEASRDQAARCTAQAASMMRQAQGAVRLLMRLQVQRAKRDTNDATATQAAWCEHGAAGWMLDWMGESLEDRRSLTDQHIETNMRQPEAASAVQVAGQVAEPSSGESTDWRQTIENSSFETIMRSPSSPAATEPDEPPHPLAEGGRVIPGTPEHPPANNPGARTPQPIAQQAGKPRKGWTGPRRLKRRRR